LFAVEMAAFFRQKPKKDLATSQVPLQFAGSNAQSLRFRPET
jgi:hypothetical protein